MAGPPDRQRRFIEALADCGSVGEAATRAGMSKQSAYTLRRHPAAADFRAGWDAALADAWRRIEETALERAIGGETDIYDRDGFQIIRHRPCAPQLLIHMLDRADRARSAAKAMAGRAPDDGVEALEALPRAEPIDAESIAMRNLAAITRDFVDRSDVVADEAAKPA
jgi:hypothetical protein